MLILFTPPIITNFNFSDFVRLGEWNNSSPIDCSEDGVCADPVVDIKIAEILKHEKYVDGVLNRVHYANDIALIRLSRKVTYTDYIRPICLPPKDLEDSYFDGAELVVAGWGRTSIEGKRVRLAFPYYFFIKPLNFSIYQR